MNKSQDLSKALPPITSLLRKSEKALQKLTPGTWQHTMLEENLQALRLASALLNGKSNDPDLLTRDNLEAALRAFAAMTTRSEQAQSKFAAGTSQHTLLQNRLQAFRTAEVRINAELK